MYYSPNLHKEIDHIEKLHFIYGILSESESFVGVIKTFENNSSKKVTKNIVLTNLDYPVCSDRLTLKLYSNCS